MTEEFLTEEEFASIGRVTNDTLGLTLPKEDIVSILKDNMDLYGDIKQFDVGDTLTRDDLASVLTMILVGKRVPSYGDVREGFDTDKFWKSVAEAAKEKGWLTEEKAENQ